MVARVLDYTSSLKQKNDSLTAVEPPRGIFGVPLNVSIKYANVAISLTNDHGESFIYGYVPIVVAKCGVFLKEKGEKTQGNVSRIVANRCQQPTWKGYFD